MPEAKNNPTLVIFCKKPTLFQGKQRLAKSLGAEQALAFAQSFLNCALEDAHDWPGPVVLSPASLGDKEWASALLDRDHLVLAQPEGGLGERLQTIDQELRARGYDQLIFIGTDGPALTASHYAEARKALNLNDVVLCPASDGGVAIMGSRVSWPDLQHLPWSSDRLGQALEAQCRGKGLSVKNITPSYDVDVEADLVKLWQDLSVDFRPARQQLHQQLSEFLEQDQTHYG